METQFKLLKNCIMLCWMYPLRVQIGQCHRIEPILRACPSLLSRAPKSAGVSVSTWLRLESTVLICAALTTIYNVKLLRGSCKIILYEVGSEPISLALGNQRVKPISISSIHMYQEEKYFWLGLWTKLWQLVCVGNSLLSCILT